MNRRQEQAIARQLRHFDAVWSRVTAAKSARDAAAAQGVELRPRRRQSCRRCPRQRG